MNWLEAIILGLVQGLCEFLPISSSGHMGLFTHFTNIDASTAGLFSAMLHIGTLVAILVSYYKPLYELFEEFFKMQNDSEMSEEQRKFVKDIIEKIEED